MKQISIVIICLLISSCSAQTKINSGSEISILIKTPQKPNKKIEFFVENNSKKNIIIDPFGFYGEFYFIANNKILEPVTTAKGHYDRIDNQQCIKDMILLRPREKKKVSLNLAYNNKMIYDFSPYDNFIWIIKSIHNRDNVTRLGCDSYLTDLESKGYNVLSDTIKAQIPFIK